MKKIKGFNLFVFALAAVWALAVSTEAFAQGKGQSKSTGDKGKKKSEQKVDKEKGAKEEADKGYGKADSTGRHKGDRDKGDRDKSKRDKGDSGKGMNWQGALAYAESLILAEALIKAGVDILDLSPSSGIAPGDRAAPFTKLGAPVIAVMEVPEDETHRYGIVDPGASSGALVAEPNGDVRTEAPARRRHSASACGSATTRPAQPRRN